MANPLKITPSPELNLKNITKLLLPVILIVSSPLCIAESYQMNVLFNPSASQLQTEAKGRVMIYDGLKSDTIKLAMDQQFHRIEHMMFVRTLEKQEDESYEEEDDGCD